MAHLTTGVTLDGVRAFMNTVDVETGVDHLTDREAFGAWLAGSGLTEAAVAPTADDLDGARRLRSALRDLACANHDGIVDPAGTRALNDLATAVGLTVRFTAGGEVELASPARGATGVLAGIVAAVAAATADGSWRRVKVCANDECRWAFQDSSRNRSGRWCSMAVCGNRMKARNFRSRH